jgi:hypothetical protein
MSRSRDVCTVSGTHAATGLAVLVFILSDDPPAWTFCSSHSGSSSCSPSSSSSTRRLS